VNVIMAAAALAAATLVSEDAATIAAGTLVALHGIPAAAAVAAVAFGIWAGDLGLFALGRLARHSAPVARWIDRRWPLHSVSAMETRLNRGVPLAVFASRFLPGTRVVLYVAAGLLRVRFATFAVSAALASVIWTASIVLIIGALGR
jgi:membrane protein DedA with SNARE-associated domain